MVSDFAYIYSVIIWWTSNIYNPKFTQEPRKERDKRNDSKCGAEKDLVSVSN